MRPGNIAAPSGPARPSILQLGDLPAALVLEALESNKPIARIEDVRLVLADRSRKAIAQVTMSLYRPAHGRETSVYYLAGPRYDKADKHGTNTGVR